MKLFGFSFGTEKTKKVIPSPIAPSDEMSDDAINAGGRNLFQHNFDAIYKNQEEQIIEYRTMSQNGIVADAIEEIVNEAIVFDGTKPPVKLNLDMIEKKDLSLAIRKKIEEEFDYILSLMNFNTFGDDIFKKWYIDGRLVYHVLIDTKSTKKGILELRTIDPTKIKKVRENIKQKNSAGVEEVVGVNEFYVYKQKTEGAIDQVVQFSKDSIVETTSGFNTAKGLTASYLETAIKPLNLLSGLEDSLVIYRVVRAPERRIFYIDIGNLPKTKGEEYIKNIMNKYRNKFVFDSGTGAVSNKKNLMSMMEDVWLPRSASGKGTEVDSLSGGSQLGEMEDVNYFYKKMYRALHIPFSRFSEEATFNLARTSEITRDEIKFSKFIDRLRKRFSHVFKELLEKQVILKNIMVDKDWEEIENNIIFNFASDSYFSELKEAEIINNRIEGLSNAESYIGEYISKTWAQRNILMMSDKEIENMTKEIAKEGSDAENE